MKGKYSRDISIAHKIAVVALIIILDLLVFASTYLVVMPVFRIPAAEFELHIFNFVVSTVAPVFFLSVFGAYKFKNLKNFFRLIYLSAISLFISLVLNLILDILFFETRSLRYLLYYFLASFAVVIFLRLLYFFVYHLYLRIKHNKFNSEHALIVGAGFTGRMVYNELYNYESKYVPICFVDDDEDKIGSYIQGIRVLGPTILIPEIVKKYNVKSIIIAIPSCSDEDKKRILKYCADTECEVSILPSGKNLTRSIPMLSQVTKIDVEKLINSDEQVFDTNDIEEKLKNKSCLVTGAGGSIGAELCRQISKCDISKLVLLDINENSTFEIYQELLVDCDKNKINIEIVSIRDFDKLDELFNKYKFDIVFHSAAHKHVPLLESAPEEAIKNNCIGTNNLAKLCNKYDVSDMIFISTDKSSTPDNIMAASKRISEVLLKYYNSNSRCNYKNIRFGNVLGSNGSVVQLFLKQINQGGPITVTHPEILRYFVTVSECVHLILRSATLSENHSTFILDIGKSVKILTLAENLIRMCGYEPYEDIDIKFSGLRPGENLKEKTFSREDFYPTNDEKILRVKSLHFDFNDFMKKYLMLEEAALNNDSNKVVEIIDDILK